MLVTEDGAVHSDKNNFPVEGKMVPERHDAPHRQCIWGMEI
jgi:hypothetical protein